MASTGVKDPSLPDTLYVTELVSSHLVNTMPEKTMMATKDHGVIPAESIMVNIADAKAFMETLAATGINFNEVTELLETEGVDKFIVSWGELVDGVKNALEAAK